MSHSHAFWRTSLKASGALVVVSSFAALSLVGCPSSGIGDPCTPEDEYKEQFSGFTLESAFIESRSFQCQTRLCLVNHFQGRVSCPKGQAAPKNCNPANGTDGPCGEGETCKAAGVVIDDCDPTPCGSPGADPANCNADGGKNNACGGLVCDKDGRFCRCSSGACGDGFYCDPTTNLCTTKVCAPKPTSKEGQERCYIPGTDIPIAVAVCGQCDTNSKRNADQSVYCTCRCAPPADNPSAADDNFNFCECPEGFECTEINPNVGLGDAQLAGSYCIKQGTKYDDASTNCGSVDGYVGSDANCQGSQK
ncbi:MAG: hypothetical protein FJ096_11985 [Deltaproteobacteria bacterium]|nr:hypothetical protein [Deltaproteobacteria bacterium]